MSIASSAARRIGLAAVTTVACAATLVPACALAAAPAGAPTSSPGGRAANNLTADAISAGRAAHGPGASAQEALEAYWTPERMRAARPAEESPEFKAAVARHERGIPAAKKQAAGQEPKPAGKPFEIPPTRSDAPATLKRSAFNPNYSYWQIPAYTNGKIFFTTSTGAGRVCSGAIVNTEGADTVWTAGHCLHSGSGGTWHANWAFVPAYDDDLANPAPYGTWTPWWVQTRPAWASSSDFSEDMGVLIMNTNLGGWHIVNYFGGHGFRANQGKYTYENSFGYPAESPFDGGNLNRCWGYATPEWTSGTVTSETIRIPCDMTRGASGGPWLYQFDGNWGFLNGVNSRLDKIVGPTTWYSPYFDNTAVDLFNITRNM